MGCMHGSKRGYCTQGCGIPRRHREPVKKDDVLVIYLRDNDVDAVHWRSPDGAEMTALCDIAVIRDGQERCPNCGEFDSSVNPPHRPFCNPCEEALA